MMTLLLLVRILLPTEDPMIQLTVHFVRASQSDTPSVNAALREVEADLKALRGFNRFELEGVGQVRFVGDPQNRDPILLHVATPAGTYRVVTKPGNHFNRTLVLNRFTIYRETRRDETMVTGTGIMQKTTRVIFDQLLETTLRVSEQQLSIAGTLAAPSAKGPVTYVVVVEVTSR